MCLSAGAAGAETQDAPLRPISLFEDYGCPAGPPMTQNGDGTWSATQARKDRLDCGITKAQAELEFWRGKKAAPNTSAFQFLPSHGVIAVLGFVTSIATAYLENRTARHLGVLPWNK